jgi:hypothetical protein
MIWKTSEETIRQGRFRYITAVMNDDDDDDDDNEFYVG